MFYSVIINVQEEWEWNILISKFFDFGLLTTELRKALKNHLLDSDKRAGRGRTGATGGSLQVRPFCIYVCMYVLGYKSAASMFWFSPKFRKREGEEKNELNRLKIVQILFSFSSSLKRSVATDKPCRKRNPKGFVCFFFLSGWKKDWRRRSKLSGNGRWRKTYFDRSVLS